MSPPRLLRRRARHAHARAAHVRSEGPGQLRQGGAVRPGDALRAVRHRGRDERGAARLARVHHAAGLPDEHAVLRAVHAHEAVVRGRHGQARGGHFVHGVRGRVLQRREGRDAGGHHTHRGGIQRHHRAAAL